MIYLVVILGASAVLCVALLRNTGRKPWEGIVLGLGLGVIGVVVAVVLAMRHKPTTSP